MPSTTVESPISPPVFKATFRPPGVWSPKTEAIPDGNGNHPSENQHNDGMNLRSMRRQNDLSCKSKSGFRSVTEEAATMKEPPRKEASLLSDHSNCNSPSLPPSQSPTITLLRKAREGQIPRGAMYIDETIHNDNENVPKGAVLYDSKTVYDGDKVHTDNYYVVPTKSVKTTTSRTIHQDPIKYEGIGPTTVQGIPVSLRTKVKDENVSDWYRQMYNSLHRVNHYTGGPRTIRYKKKGKPVYSSRSGYLSEPEYERNDDEYYRKKNSVVGNGYKKHVNEKLLAEESERNTFLPEDSYRSEFNPYLPDSEIVQTSHDVYKHQPKSIDSYEPGSSSIVERELKLDEDSRHDQYFSVNVGNKRSARSPLFSYRDGYESDTTLIRKSEQPRPPSPQAQQLWYKEIQKGGEIPIGGLRKVMPEKPKEPSIGPITSSWSGDHQATERSSRSPPPKPEPLLPHLLSSSDVIDVAPSPTPSQESAHKFQESQVNIHYNTPVRSLERDYEEEKSMMRHQMMMRDRYDEERRKRQLREWADMEARKHGDVFMPSQKSPIPYNRYDGVYDINVVDRPRLSVSPSTQYTYAKEPKTISRALFDFVAQSQRELPFSKGDLIYITKKIDKNWYEGEHHGMVGILPVSYVEIIPPEMLKPAKKKGQEGQAKVAYTFSAKSPVELSLLKGEVVTLLRRIDENWFEGKLGRKTGIFPASYVDVMKEPSDQGRSSLSPRPARVRIDDSQNTVHVTSNMSNGRRSKSPDKITRTMNGQTLHVDTRCEPEPYQAMFSYKPQNEDELELNEGDTVYVMEKCDDGWYVGTSMRTGLFGTFPGNYVEKL